MARKKPDTLPLGTISEGTLKSDDLVYAYLWDLGRLRLRRTDRQTLQRCQRDYDAYCSADEPTDEQIEALDGAVEDLQEMADNYCPDYAYHGSLEGDGACFGVWPNIDGLEDDTRETRYLQANDPRAHGATVLKVDAGDVFPEPASCHYDHIVEVTDHGNITLYRRSGNRWVEVWSVV